MNVKEECVLVTVLEYLKVVNGIFDNRGLDSSMIKYNGFIDILPKYSEKVFNYMGTNYIIESGNIIVERYIKISDGSIILLRKVTSLNDDVSLHCIGGMLSDMLEMTIDYFEDKRNYCLKNPYRSDTQKSDLSRKYQKQIEILRLALDNSNQNNIKHVKKKLM